MAAPVANPNLYPNTRLGCDTRPAVVWEQSRGAYVAGTSTGMGLRMPSLRVYSNTSTGGYSTTGTWSQLNQWCKPGSTQAGDDEQLAAFASGHLPIISVEPPQFIWSSTSPVSAWARISGGGAGSGVGGYDYSSNYGTGSANPLNRTDGLYAWMRRLYSLDWGGLVDPNYGGTAAGVGNGAAYGGRKADRVWVTCGHEPNYSQGLAPHIYGTGGGWTLAFMQEYQAMVHHLRVVERAVRAEFGGVKRVYLMVCPVAGDGGYQQYTGPLGVAQWGGDGTIGQTTSGFGKWLHPTYNGPAATSLGPNGEMDIDGYYEDVYFQTTANPSSDPMPAGTPQPHIWADPPGRAKSIDTLARWVDNCLSPYLPVGIGETAVWAIAGQTPAWKNSFWSEMPPYFKGNQPGTYLYNNALAADGGPRVVSVSFWQPPDTQSRYTNRARPNAADVAFDNSTPATAPPLQSFDAIRAAIAALIPSTVPTPPPPAPAAMTARATVGATTSIDLSVTASSGATGYRFYRSTSSTGTFTALPDVTTTTTTATGLLAGTTYYFRATAFNAVGESAPTAVVSTRTNTVAGDTTPPSAPGVITVGTITTSAQAASVPLSWVAATDNVAVGGYDVFRDVVPTATGTPLASVVAPAVTYTDATAVPGTPVTYYVRAVDTAGNLSAGYASQVAAIPAYVTPPTAGLAVTPATGVSPLTVSIDVSATAAGSDVLHHVTVDPGDNTGLLTIYWPSSVPTLHTLPSVTASTSYTVTATAYDVNGVPSAPVTAVVEQHGITVGHTSGGMFAVPVAATEFFGRDAGSGNLVWQWGAPERGDWQTAETALVSRARPRGAWTTATAYAVNDVVTVAGAAYRCLVAHTSGSTFSGVGSGSWESWAAVAYGTTAGTALQGNDPAVSNSRTPTTHALTHASDGTDGLHILSGVAPGQNTPTRVETFLRVWCQVTPLAQVSNTQNFTFFTAAAAKAISAITTATLSGNTNPTVPSPVAAAGTTLGRLALFTVAGNGDLTLVARSTNDTARWNVAGAQFIAPLDSTVGFPASYPLLRGTRYAVGFVWAGTTGPTIAGMNFQGSGLGALDPLLGASITAGGDFSATPGSTIAYASLGVAAVNKVLYASLA